MSDARLEELSCAACGIDTPAILASLAKKVFMIVIQDFQDPYTLNVKQLMKCCVEEITPDGRLIPFCAYNSVGYREQVRSAMSGVPVADVVPNALSLADQLVERAGDQRRQQRGQDGGLQRGPQPQRHHYPGFEFLVPSWG